MQKRKKRIDKKMFIILLLIILSVPSLSASKAEEIGCEVVDNNTMICPVVTPIEIKGIFTDDIHCFSSYENFTTSSTNISSLMDIGCYSSINILNPIQVKICSRIFTTNESYVNCSTTIFKGEKALMIPPDLVIFENCKVNTTNTITHEIICPYKGKEVSVKGITNYGVTIIAGEITEKKEDVFSLLIISSIITVGLVLILLKIKKPKKSKTKTKRRRVR